MVIHDAINAMIHGHRVARSFWDVGTYLFHDNEHPGFPRVAVGENPPVNYMPSIHDLLARDWVTVRHKAPNTPNLSLIHI